jgi:hypothetical protein
MALEIFPAVGEKYRPGEQNNHWRLRDVREEASRAVSSCTRESSLMGDHPGICVHVPGLVNTRFHYYLGRPVLSNGKVPYRYLSRTED